jgi:hypothetical protein
MAQEPTWITVELVTQQASNDAEIVNLLTQVMDRYAGKLMGYQQRAIAQWFATRYGETCGPQ